jgi:hypothetical protein
VDSRSGGAAPWGCPGLVEAVWALSVHARQCPGGWSHTAYGRHPVSLSAPAVSTASCALLTRPEGKRIKQGRGIFDKMLKPMVDLKNKHGQVMKVKQVRLLSVAHGAARAAACDVGVESHAGRGTQHGLTAAPARRCGTQSGRGAPRPRCPGHGFMDVGAVRAALGVLRIECALGRAVAALN